MKNEFMKILLKVTELISGYLQTYTMMQKQQNEVLKTYEDLHKEHSSKPRKSNEISDEISQKQILAVKEVILKLERSLSHLRLDKEHLLKNEVILNEEISKKTRDHNLEKHLLVEKRRKVQVIFYQFPFSLIDGLGFLGFKLLFFSVSVIWLLRGPIWVAGGKPTSLTVC